MATTTKQSGITSGPWHQYPLRSHELEVWSEGDGPQDDGSPSSVQICDVLTSAADARLIAAAPEMLTALEAARAVLIDDEPSEASDRAFRILSEAIARAKGKV